MFKFGNPPRSLESFGAAGLLDPTCEVFHQTLFSSRHAGRVADLLVARLRDEKLDELRFRAAILFGLFQDAGVGVTYPAVVECGIDGEKLALSVSFESALRPDAHEAGRRLAGLRAQADGVIVRYCAQASRVEVVAMLGIPGRLSTTPDARLKNFELVEIAMAAEAPKALTYTALGDLDYAELLAEDEAARKAADRGGPPMRVRGPTPTAAAETTVIRGDEPEAEKILQLQTRIRELESSRSLGSFLRSIWPFRRGQVPGPSLPALEPLPAVATAKPPVDPPSLEKQVESELDLAQALDLDPDAGLERLTQAPTSMLDAASTATPENDAQRLVKEVESGELIQALGRATAEAEQIKREISSDRARRWVDGFMADMLAEKARLLEMARRVHSSVRQKEHEFRTAEQRLLEEIRMRDELLKQRSTALARAKEQLSQLAAAGQGRDDRASKPAKDDPQLQMKYILSQRLLATAKKEAMVMCAKLEETKAQAARGKAILGEVSNIKAKLERSVRQVEELKRSNQQLQDRAGAPGSELKPKGATQALEEMKKKVDGAARIAAKAQAQTEQMQLKLEELQREESRLKKELASAQEQLRAKGTAA